MTEAFVLGKDVRAALDEGRPIVALESSVLAQGLPHPRNVEAMEAMDAAIRSREAQPAWIAVLGGRLVVGVARDDLLALATTEGALKVARRDLAVAVASGRPGATTVSATLWAAHRAGIEVMATGGIGGVHVGTGDVSADLLELARTPGTVVCSGPKSIVDPAATMERLEELGVAVIGYRCDRLPFFVVREADVTLEHRADSLTELAAMVGTRRELRVDSALLVCHPIPEEAAMERGEIESAVRRCLTSAERAGATGKAVTPFLLSCLAEETGGRSIDANIALLESNATLASAVAFHLAPAGSYDPKVLRRTPGVRG